MALNIIDQSDIVESRIQSVRRRYPQAKDVTWTALQVRTMYRDVSRMSHEAFTREVRAAMNADETHRRAGILLFLKAAIDQGLEAADALDALAGLMFTSR